MRPLVASYRCTLASGDVKSGRVLVENCWGVSWWKSWSLTSTRWIRVCVFLLREPSTNKHVGRSVSDEILVIPESSSGTSEVRNLPCVNEEMITPLFKSLRLGTPKATTAPLRLRSTTTCPRLNKENWLAEQTEPDLSCQIGLAHRCMPTLTVEQIRTAHHWVHRARQFADMHLTLGEHPSETAPSCGTYESLVERPGRDRKNARRVHDCCDQSCDECWKSGSVEPLGLEVTQAEKRMHVELGWRSEVFEFESRTFAMGHVSVRRCSVHRLLLEKTGTRTFSGSRPSVSSTAKSVQLRDQTWSTDWNRRQTLCHHPWMPPTNGRDFTVVADGADAGRCVDPR